jgi:hypothetical protein
MVWGNDCNLTPALSLVRRGRSVVSEVVCLGGVFVFLVDVPDGRQERYDNDCEYDWEKILINIGNNAAEEVAKEGQAYGPAKAADHVVGEKIAIVHVGHPGNDRREGPDDRDKPGEYDRFFAVLVIELLGGS